MRQEQRPRKNGAEDALPPQCNSLVPLKGTKAHVKSGQSRENLRSPEESLDFIEEDTSERLGAARLRKVQQKTHRRIFRTD